MQAVQVLFRPLYLLKCALATFTVLVALVVLLLLFSSTFLAPEAMPIWQPTAAVLQAAQPGVLWSLSASVSVPDELVLADLDLWPLPLANEPRALWVTTLPMRMLNNAGHMPTGEPSP